jgi:hypothetical protein
VNRLQFIDTIKPACLAAESIHGIPWGWLVAQAIQESGWYGVSELSTKAHNLYGIKGNDYMQGNVGYASFATWMEAIMFQGWQLNVQRYLPFKSLVVAGQFKKYGDAISKAGWCPVSNPTYGSMIEQIARDYDLDWIPAPIDQPKPVAQHSVAVQWCMDHGIITDPTRPVDIETIAGVIFKSRGKLG